MKILRCLTGILVLVPCVFGQEASDVNWEVLNAGTPEQAKAEIERLLNAGVDFAAKNREGDTVLDLAMASPHPKAKTISLILDAGGNWSKDRISFLGGGKAHKYKLRAKGAGKAFSTRKSKAALKSALEWLAVHQSDKGYWDCDEFMQYDEYPEAIPRSDGPGISINDVGVTGLAMLAFLGDGNSLNSGPFQENLTNGVQWLIGIQDEYGYFGPEIGNSSNYNQAIATLALGEAFLHAQNDDFKKPYYLAISAIKRARNLEHPGWRYGREPTNGSDTSITSWMVQAALLAVDNGVLKADDDLFMGASTHFEWITDPDTGRTGYAFGSGGGAGGLSGRLAGMHASHPAKYSEALSAATMFCHLLMTNTKEVKSLKRHPNYGVLSLQASLLKETLPVWNSDGSSNDLYYWYYGTLAMRQWNIMSWRIWKSAVGSALVENQRIKEKNLRGSWDPTGPWGQEGGRIYSTALGALILESEYRYNRTIR